MALLNAIYMLGISLGCVILMYSTTSGLLPSIKQLHSFIYHSNFSIYSFVCNLSFNKQLTLFPLVIAKTYRLTIKKALSTTSV